MHMMGDKWPSLSAITGVDLSVYKLAVCASKHNAMVRRLQTMLDPHCCAKN